jgi:dienelactone hydrolase
VQQVTADRDRSRLHQLLGTAPTTGAPVVARRLRRETRERYELEVLLLELNDAEPVPAYFVTPRGGGVDRHPTILYHHAHGGDFELGKDELLDGRDLLRRPAYAEALTDAGYAALCIDAWGFGERRGRSQDAIFKDMLWHDRVLWGAMMHDALRALDYVTARADVDPDRIGTLGMSMGSTTAWWLAALDPRIRVCVDLCCLTDFHTLLRDDGLDRHGTYYFVPGLLNHFTAAQINALIAPRPHLALAGLYDPLTPREGLDAIDGELQKVYADQGAAEAWQLRRFACGHLETEAMRQAALEFLAEWL